MVAPATGPSEKCSQRYAPNVAKTPKYRSNPAETDQCIVAIATMRSDQVGDASLALIIYIGWGYPTYPGISQQKMAQLNERGSNMNIYVGNLSREVTEEDLRQEFTAFGEVQSVTVIKDKYSGQSRGFAFVEMPSKSEGQAAIDGLAGKTLQDRTLDVNEARPRSDSRGGGSYGTKRGGGSRGGGRQRQRRY